MSIFKSDFQHMVNAAGNIEPKRYPLYEHTISFKVMEKVLQTSFADLVESKDINRLMVAFYFRFHCFLFLLFLKQSSIQILTVIFLAVGFGTILLRFFFSISFLHCCYSLSFILYIMYLDPQGYFLS